MTDREFQIVRYRPGRRDEWEAFASRHGSIFHRRRFLQYHPHKRFQDHSLQVMKKGRLFGLFPAAQSSKDNRLFLVSNPGATFGALVTDPAAGMHDLLRGVEQLLAYSRKSRFQSIQMTLPPIIYHQRLSNNLEYCCRQAGFQYIKQELSGVIELRHTPGSEFIKPSVGRAVRRAAGRGITIERTDNFRAFYPILLSNLSMRHNVKPTHTLQELLKLQHLFPAAIRLFGAYKNSKMIGGIVLFECNRQVALAFYISHDVDYQKDRVVDSLMVHIIDWCRQAGFHYLDLGTFTLNFEPNWGLARFKEKFGARGIFRNTLELLL